MTRDPYPPGTNTAWAEIHQVERDAGLKPSPIPGPPFDPDYNLIRYRGLSDRSYWLIMGGMVAGIVLAVILTAVFT